MSDTTIINIIQAPVTPVKVNVLGISSGGGSGDGLTEVKNEEITGITIPTINMAHSPAAGKLSLYKNGSLLPNSEYTNNGNPITLTTIPIATDVFTGFYKY